MADPKKASLRSVIARKELVIAPGVIDMITARLADKMGFHALYMTGYGVTASSLGLPDAGLATYSDMLSRVRTICEGTSTPLIADADTGYGGLINVRHTVRGYEAAGAQGIQIEDQEMPKKCGHTPGRRVIPAEEMVLKVKVAVDSRRSEDTLIIARTDARTTLGLDEALRRGEAYAEAGADIIFVESPESEDELAKIARSISKPVLANMVQFGRTPLLTEKQLRDMGFAVAIYPGIALGAVAEAARRAYLFLKQHGTSKDIDVPMYEPRTSGQSLHELMGFPDIWAFEKRWQMPDVRQTAAE
ncbi:isocitrate lyase/PEP mutase family protein [Bradyrhizobium sp. LHD-71]|uniref:isocitrate lyase/PEP mutase family protein n=1 Tax=Bradyrhizobium sp. LHD-71 TaxID=3072141 RepID=UPI00280FC415|nr:isocitrate lyase/PEP mutase family protein [Bradyrhizobium sp. LHD-71]MDQ8728481.1 isocitrate lyase/PEP mutase family protein [Bradyrhizobium sp. LHD-71]